MAHINELAPNTAVDHQGRLAYLPSGLIPREVVGPIFDKAQDTSLVLRQGRSIPIGYGETIIPVNTKRPEVGQVGTGTTNALREGAAKPLTGVAWDQKTISPIKLAAIVTASEEFVRSNVSGLWDGIRDDLALAIGRGIDLAVYHGKQPLTGAALAGISATNVLNNTANAVSFSADPATTIVDDLIAGYEVVADDHEFNGWAADPRYRPALIRASQLRDSTGATLDPAGVNLDNPVSNLLGFPVQYGRAVGGRLGAAADTTTRIIGGDFNQLAYGFADQIRFKVSDTATLTDGVSTVNLWQTNQVAILVEVTFGWIVGDLDAFVKFTT